MSLNRAKELRQERTPLIEQAGALLTKAHDEDRELTSEEREQFESLHAKADTMLNDALMLERQHEAESSINEIRLSRAESNNRSADEELDNEQRELRAFKDWMRFGINGVRDDDMDIARRSIVNGIPKEVRAAQTVTTTGGGYLIPRGFQQELDMAMQAYGGMRQASRVVTTSTGNTLDWPTIDDTSNTGELLTINTQVSEQALTYGQVTFEAYKYSSKAVKVPVELMQDSAFDMDSHVREVLAERLGRITNTHFTTGDGSSKPKGVVECAANSNVTPSDSSAVTLANLIAIEHSVDPSYRAGAAWMFNDTTLAEVKGLLDSNGRPIFRPATETPGQIDTMLGYPIWINQDMAGPTDGNKAILFGAFNKFIIRIVRPMVMLRLDERYADLHQVGFFAFERCDSDIVDASGGAIKYAQYTT